MAVEFEFNASCKINGISFYEASSASSSWSLSSSQLPVWLTAMETHVGENDVAAYRGNPRGDVRFPFLSGIIVLNHMVVLGCVDGLTLLARDNGFIFNDNYIRSTTNDRDEESLFYDDAKIKVTHNNEEISYEGHRGQFLILLPGGSHVLHFNSRIFTLINIRTVTNEPVATQLFTRSLLTDGNNRATKRISLSIGGYHVEMDCITYL